ncbi:MAG TPA: type II secretion system F family protein [Methylovirgula sp.]
MFNFDLNSLILMVLAATATGGVLYVFVYPLLSGENKAEKRKATFVGAASARKISDRQIDANARRKQIVDSLKEIETRNKKKKVTLEARIIQAGLTWSKKQFAIYSIAAALLMATLLFMMSKSWIIAFAGALIGGLGLPRWFLNFAGKRRLRKFTDEFPEAIDIIVRGVKAGLPLGDCLRIIASEMRDPIKTEFRLIVESQAMGLSPGEAVERLVARLPTAETSFFAIVIGIQQKAGGNLSEALSNLSGVLRDRKKMKGKIQALSSEAKASAYIIGSLPFVVAGLVYLTSPTYIMLLWTTLIGRLVMAACAIWMGMGVFVMKKMVSFDI